LTAREIGDARVVPLGGTSWHVHPEFTFAGQRPGDHRFEHRRQHALRARLGLVPLL